MTYFVCLANETPCQPANQLAVTEVTVNDLAQLGITPESVMTAVGSGFGLVLALALMGYVLGLVLRVIRMA